MVRSATDLLIREMQDIFGKLPDFTSKFAALQIREYVVELHSLVLDLKLERRDVVVVAHDITPVTRSTW